MTTVGDYLTRLDDENKRLRRENDELTAQVTKLNEECEFAAGQIHAAREWDRAARIRIRELEQERDQRHAEAIHLAKGLHEIGKLIVPDKPDDDALIIDHVRELLDRVKALESRQCGHADPAPPAAHRE